MRQSYSELNQYELALDPARKKLGGVCAGLARYLDVSTAVVRVVALVSLVLFTQATLIAYGLAYLILDEKTDDETLLDSDWDDFDD